MSGDDFQAEIVNVIAAIRTAIQVQNDTFNKVSKAIMAVQQAHFLALANALHNAGIPVPNAPEMPELDLEPFDFEAVLEQNLERTRERFPTDSDSILSLEVID